MRAPWPKGRGMTGGNESIPSEPLAHREGEPLVTSVMRHRRQDGQQL